MVNAKFANIKGLKSAKNGYSTRQVWESKVKRRLAKMLTNANSATGTAFHFPIIESKAEIETKDAITIANNRIEEAHQAFQNGAADIAEGALGKAARLVDIQV